MHTRTFKEQQEKIKFRKKKKQKKKKQQQQYFDLQSGDSFHITDSVRDNCFAFNKLICEQKIKQFENVHIQWEMCCIFLYK